MATRKHQSRVTRPEPAADHGLDLGPLGPWATEPEFRQSQFFGELLNRLVTGRDMNIIVTAASETGVGKTTLAVAIAMLVDQHGWTADKAAVASAAEYDHLYDQAKPGSALILDEAEKAADARRGMKSESVSLTQSFATKRYRQVFSILTAPSKSWVDNRLGSDAADYWIQAQETDMGRIKGESKVYRLRTHEHYETDYTKRTEMLHWPNMDDNPEFQRLDERKREVLESGDEEGFVASENIEKIKEDVAKSASKEQERKTIKKVYEESELSGSEVAEIFGCSDTWVYKVVNGEVDS